MEMSPTCAAATRATEHQTPLEAQAINKMHGRCKAAPGRGSSQSLYL